MKQSHKKMMKFHEQMRAEQRKAQKMVYGDLMRGTGLRHSRLADIEYGRERPTVRERILILKVLGIYPGEIEQTLENGPWPTMVREMRDSIKDRQDAERWRALISSQRIRILGHTGVGSMEYQHFGIEAWSTFPDAPAGESEQGRDVLTAYVDAIISAERRG